jgi:hypothetical protein
VETGLAIRICSNILAGAIPFRPDDSIRAGSALAENGLLLSAVFQLWASSGKRGENNNLYQET